MQRKRKFALIRAGLGWGSLSDLQVLDALATGRLVRFRVTDLVRNSQMENDAYPAHRLDEALGPVAQAFRRALTEPPNG